MSFVSVIIRYKPRSLCFIITFFYFVLLHFSCDAKIIKTIPTCWNIEKIGSVLNIFHTQKITDYSFKFRLETKKNNKISDGILYFSQVNGTWKFRIECDEMRVLLTKGFTSSVDVYDIKQRKFFTKKLDEILIPGHELTGNDLLSEFLHYPLPLNAYFSRTSGRDCYCIICEEINKSYGFLRYIHGVSVDAKKNLKCNFVLKPEYRDYDFASNYQNFQDCVKAYFDAEFAAVLKAEFYKNAQIVHSFQLRNFKRVKNDWTVRKIEIKNYLNDTKSIFDVKYAALNIKLPQEIFFKNNLKEDIKVGRIFYEKCF